MGISKIQPSFSAGELSPSLHSRVDISKYQVGLKTCKNFLIHLSGGVSRRTGTKYIASAKYVSDSAKKIKLVPFEVSSDVSYMLEFGEHYLRFYKNQAQIMSGASPYEITTPYSASDTLDIKFVQSADVLFITHPNYPPYELSRNSDTSWTIEVYDYEYPPFMLSNQDKVRKIKVSDTVGSTEIDTNFDLFEQGHVGSYFKIYHDIDGQAIKQTFTATGTTSAISCYGYWRFRTFSYAARDLTVKIEKSTDGGSTWSVLRTYIIYGTANSGSLINDYDTEDEFCLIRLNCTAFASGDICSLTSDSFSKAGIVRIDEVIHARAAAGEVIDKFASQAYSDDWAESSWSTLRGFPASVAFYQDRLVFAGTKTEPQTIWMTETGNYYSFKVSDIIKSSDSISIELTSKKLNKINNLILINDLIAMTSSSEWRVGSYDGKAVSATTVSSSMQGNRGGSNITPLLIGNKIVYFQPSNAILRDLGYDYNNDAFVGDNLSILASHLFNGYGILDMDYQQEPDSIVWIVRSDGKLITMTYMKEEEILGFSRHETDGAFENIAILKTKNNEEIWVSVVRNGKRYIEVFQETTTINEDQWYLDSGLKYDGALTTIISGLNHLEGKEVFVFGDGNVIKTLNDTAKTPIKVENGQITLPYAVKKAVIGLPFISDFETLDIDLNLQNGTLQDKKIKISQAIFIFENTRGGFFGDADVGEITDTTHEKSLDEFIQKRSYLDKPIDLFSGRAEITLNSSWGIGKRLFYRQYDPLPTTILAVIPKITVGG